MAWNAERSGEPEGRQAEPRHAGGAPAPGPEHVAAYIAELTTELAELARSHKLDLLVYLLEMASLEASSRE